MGQGYRKAMPGEQQPPSRLPPNLPVTRQPLSEARCPVSITVHGIPQVFRGIPALGPPWCACRPPLSLLCKHVLPPQPSAAHQTVQVHAPHLHRSSDVAPRHCIRCHELAYAAVICCMVSHPHHSSHGRILVAHSTMRREVCLGHCIHVAASELMPYLNYGCPPPLLILQQEALCCTLRHHTRPSPRLKPWVRFIVQQPRALATLPLRQTVCLLWGNGKCDLRLNNLY